MIRRTLSDEIHMDTMNVEVLDRDDVKGFIKELKKDLHDYFYIADDIVASLFNPDVVNKIIDKRAGDKLI